MTRSRRIVVLAVLGVVVAIGAIAVIVLPQLLTEGERPELTFALILFPGLAWYWALGALIVLRADGHLVGWLFATSAALVAIVFASWVGGPTLAAASGNEAWLGWFVLVGAMLFPTALLLALPAVMLTFPTGHLPSPAWRWPFGGLAALTGAGTIAILLRPSSVDGSVDNPLTPITAGLPAVVISVLDLAMALGTLTIPVGTLLGLAAVTVRFRRSRGIERAQLKWLLAATVPTAFLIPLSLSDVGQTIPGIDAVSSLSLPLLALAVAIAILRYRLYDIDRIISRTIAYTGITALSVAIFGGVILVLQGPLGQITGGGTIAVAVSTLIVAALFQPIRVRVQQVVDRRFHRARFDAERTVLGFSTRLRDEVDIAAVGSDLRATVHGAIRPTSLGLWLRASRGPVTVATRRDEP